MIRVTVLAAGELLVDVRGPELADVAGDAAQEIQDLIEDLNLAVLPGIEYVVRVRGSMTPDHHSQEQDR